MRTIRDVLKYSFEKKLSQRRVESITGVNRRSIGRILSRFQELQLPWPLPVDIDDEKLDSLIYPPSKTTLSSVEVNFEEIAEEMRKRGATLSALYEEWSNRNPEENRLSYSAFTRRYVRWKKASKLSMLSVVEYGQAAYVDYSGMTFTIYERGGEPWKAQVFVGVLGGSGYVYAEVSHSQSSMDWIASHIHMLEYFGGVPQSIVPDNLKAGVTKADRHDPVINETYKQFCRHYNTIPMPARVRKPKDKARAEGSVGFVQRVILFFLRNNKFYSLDEANRAIRVLLERLNHRPFQKREGSRFSNWLAHEQPILMPLPASQYELAEWGKVRAGPDYHVTVDHHRYSVPYEKRGTEFDFRLTRTSLELLQLGKLIATHVRSLVKEGVTTVNDHRPPAHKAVQGWTKDVAMEWAAEVGPYTCGQLSPLLDRGRGPHSGYRTMQAMKALAKRYGNTRLEDACEYATARNITGTDKLRTILHKNLDQLFKQEVEDNAAPIVDHENIRGELYYQDALKNEQGED
ncbi:MULTISPECIES: IS21 family transposase [unclassified Herbaspirillum]|uniref:IS21 family transposase n=1 Tax=unclassified Herbaspirillum TaxID=2624150 RepID=UPI00161F4A39|nr:MULTISPECIES: IS21 family transposase [unclassified Herbaspirillum]MBB5393049.1 transposase [Herbaspirillum sp. SJZ102]